VIGLKPKGVWLIIAPALKGGAMFRQWIFINVHAQKERGRILINSKISLLNIVVKNCKLHQNKNMILQGALAP
jgi:hypothetical protein